MSEPRTDTDWQTMDLMARVRAAKRRKAAEARQRLVAALERSKQARAKAIAQGAPIMQIEKRKVVRRFLTSPEAIELNLTAVDGPEQEVTISKFKAFKSRTSLPFISFIYEEA